MRTLGGFFLPVLLCSSGCTVVDDPADTSVSADNSEPENSEPKLAKADEPQDEWFPPLSGTLDAGETQTVDIDATGGDTLVMWLRKTDDSPWEPRIELFRDGKRVQYGDPPGDADAHIPWQEDQQDAGYRLPSDGDYDVHLVNQSEAAGAFVLTIDCLEGPCRGASPPPPPPPPGDDPWVGLSEQALKEALRRDTKAQHHGLGYNEARKLLFTKIHNDQGEVEDLYTGMVVRTKGIPNNNVMNTEHTWPQSRGGDGAARGDLHHLFPVKSEANSQRSSLHFCNVDKGAIEWSEGGSLRGRDESGKRCFEARSENKGEFARATFYISVVYNLRIPADEEDALRRWHEQDPPDDEALLRNDAVETYQGSRNFFVDYPHLADRISDF